MTNYWPNFQRWIFRLLAQIGDLPDEVARVIWEDISRALRTNGFIGVVPPRLDMRLVRPPADWNAPWADIFSGRGQSTNRWLGLEATRDPMWY